MVMNRRGMTALVDAMVFMLVMMVVIHITVHQADPGGPEADAGEIVDSICAVEVCVSDLTDMDDDTLVFLTDLIALHVLGGDTRTDEYLEAVLEAGCAGRDYCMSMDYAGRLEVLGVPVGHPVSSAVRQVPVMGETLTLELRLSS